MNWLCQPVEMQMPTQTLAQHLAATEPSATVWPSPSNLRVEHAQSDYTDAKLEIHMSGFFEEVKRRKVYRVAAAYIIVAGGIIQFASAAFPAWELPNWMLRLVIVLLLFGFPIALMLAWAYDITAQGVRVTPAIGVPRRHRRRNVILLAATGVILSAGTGLFLLPRVSA